MGLAPIFILLAGASIFIGCLLPDAKASFRARSAHLITSRHLRTWVRRHNVQQSIAALRANLEVGAGSVESVSIDHAGLSGRIEKIRVRNISASRRNCARLGVIRLEGPTRPPAVAPASVGSKEESGLDLQVLSLAMDSSS